MNWSKGLKKRKPNELEYCRLQRLLDIMMANNMELPEGGAKAIVCNDGVVFFDVDKDGCAVMMLPYCESVSFDINLTPEEMREFNGGAGLTCRYFKDRKEVQEKYKQ